MHTRRQFIASAALAASGALILPGLSGPARAQSPRKIVFVTPQGFLLSFTPVMVAQGGGFFAKHGLDVEVIGGNGSAQSVQQVLSGRAMTGRTGGVNLMNAAEKGAPVKSIATIAHGSPFYVMSAESSPVRSPADLKGQVVGLVSKGGATENLLNAMLLQEGIEPSAVERRYTGDNPGAYGLLETGRLKAFLGNVDTMLRAKAAGAKIIAWNTSKYAPIPGQVYVATDDSIAKDKDVLVAFLRGVREAIKSVVADQDLSATFAALAKFPVQGLDNRALAGSVIRANQELWLMEGEHNVLRNVPENWTKGVNLAVRAGFAKPIDPRKLYTNALIDEALA